MRFNKLTLTNIGAYYGNYEFDFTIRHPQKNVILFGGKNGAGKTTILESLRIALFGAFTYGFKTESETYFRKIKSYLNKIAIANHERHYQIMIEFDHVENYQRNTYIFKRRWELENNRIKETFLIMENGRYLNELDTELFHSKIREEMPPQLFEFCLFDGEEISRIISDDRLSEYLRNTAKTMFNLDYFENLEEDLAQYQKQYSNQKSRSEEENLLNNLNSELQVLNEKKQQLVESIQVSEEKIQHWQQDVENNKKEFQLYGGLVKEERDQLISKMNELEHERKIILEEMKSFVYGLLPMYLVRNELVDLRKQIELEQGFETYEYLTTTITQDKLGDIINTLEKEGLLSKNEEELATRILFHGFIDAIKPNNVEMIHRASFNQRSEIQFTLNELNKIDLPHLLNVFSQNQEYLKAILEIRKKIDHNDSTHDFKTLLDNIQSLNQEIEKTKIDLESKNVELNDLQQQIEQKKLVAENIKSKLLNHDKTENSFILSMKVIEVSKQFRSLQLQKKLQQVEIEATHMINHLFRKEEFLSKIQIDPESFEVTLISPTYQLIDKQSLSAGEKQILLLSIIWAIMKTSGRRLPFVFDTLLGRLDKTHKKSVLTKLIPKCGEQVIILSTDSEIDQEHFEYLQPILSGSYTLEFNKELKNVSVEVNQYFNIHIMELTV